MSRHVVRQWKVSITFEGRAQGVTTLDAATAFKEALGVTLSELRPDIALVNMNVTLIEEWDDPLEGKMP